MTLRSIHSRRVLGQCEPVGPRGVYDEAKRFAEAMTMAFHGPVVCRCGSSRIFNTYGPGCDGTTAVPSRRSSTRRSRWPLTVHGDGSQTRSLCYCDLIDGLWRVLPSDVVAIPVNLGNPEETKVLDLARSIVLLVGGVSDVVFTERPVDDPEVRCPDISRASSMLGWTPAIPLADGVWLARSSGPGMGGRRNVGDLAASADRSRAFRD